MRITIHQLINTSLQHAIEHVERPGGSHEGVGRKKNLAILLGALLLVGDNLRLTLLCFAHLCVDAGCFMHFLSMALRYLHARTAARLVFGPSSA